MSTQIFDRDEFFMRDALVLAHYAATSGEVPVGAVLVLEDSIIGKGWNSPISNNDPTAHAEIVALREGATRLNNYRLPNTTLYVTLEPCAMCVGAMLHARISRLVFGATDPKTGAVVSVLQLLDNPRNNHKIIYTAGMLSDASSLLLTNFFKARR